MSARDSALWHILKNIDFYLKKQNVAMLPFWKWKCFMVMNQYVKLRFDKQCLKYQYEKRTIIKVIFKLVNHFKYELRKAVSL